MTESLNDLDVGAYYKDLESSRNYKLLVSEADTCDRTTLLLSTKGKDNWNPLFSQLISAQEGDNVDASALAQSYKTLTMQSDSQEESKQEIVKPVLLI